MDMRTTKSFVTRLFNFCQGRHTTFAIFFALAGTALAAFGKLTADFVGLIGAIQGLVAFHSWKEDRKHDESTTATATAA